MEKGWGRLTRVVWGCLCLMRCSWMEHPKPFPRMVGIRKLQQAVACPGDVGRPQNPRSPLLQGMTVSDDKKWMLGLLSAREGGAPANGQHFPFPTSWRGDTLDLRQGTVWTLWSGEGWLGVAFPGARPWQKRGGQGGTMIREL